jgi:UDP-N-acetylglucosamine diphosphorylase/glucosamine-1-phosphate N-acetyltransferase
MSVSNAKLVIAILAGGLGKRMNSEIPKVLHLIGGEPMLVKIIKEAQKLHPEKILIVVGKYYSLIKHTLESYLPLDNINFIFQDQPMGTGHALKCCLIALDEFIDSKILVLSGDVPLLKENTMKDIISVKSNNLCLVVTSIQNPIGYGRIIKNEDTNKFKAIVEEKDCTEKEREITLVNCGIYLFTHFTLFHYLPLIKNNNSQNEYYLTDIVDLLVKDNYEVETLEIPFDKQKEILGVNTIEQLNELNELNELNK